MPGILIAFEGIDASGKSTQAKLLAEALRAKGRAVVLTKEPFLELPTFAGIIAGAGSVKTHKDADTLDEIGGYKLAPETDVFLFAADRAEHVHKVIKPALEAGKIVITDRYYPSSVAYQSVFGKLDEKWIGEVNRFAPRPDAIVLLDLDAEKAAERTAGGAERRLARFEVLEKQKLLRQKYLEMAERGEWIVVDALQPAETVAKQVLAALESKLGANFKA
ncbi:MAG: dTMP kinase [Candidatus Micrarchaeota archaeon]